MSKESADAFCLRLIAKPNSRDAKEWFESAKDGAQHTLGELSNMAESRAELERLYSEGAVRVIAVEIAQYPSDTAENTGKLVVELPQDPGARKRVLAWCGKWTEATGYDPEEDMGQQYVFVMMD